MSGGYQDAREQRVRIFEDTRKLYETNRLLRDAVEKSCATQMFIGESQTLKIEHAHAEKKSANTNCKVIVSGKRSLEAAMAYKGRKICVHNFASATNPGGGVEKGSNAQEEAICRCSTLLPCLKTEEMQKLFYRKHKSMLRSGELTALYNDDCIYTPGVVVFKSDTNSPKLLPAKEWFEIDVITCAAPNLRENPSNAMNPGSGTEQVKPDREELKALHKKRAGRIMETAKAMGTEVLILGAFGCGAFQNPPRVVAEAYAEILQEYRSAFETIEFAVYCPPGRTENYDAFRKNI